MADKTQNLNTNQVNSFQKGMMKDLGDIATPSEIWTHARNATVNTLRGDVATLSNESSTILCTMAPYTVIGYLFFDDDEWVIFSTDNANNHEIGIFNEALCTYTKVVSDPCLNFSFSNPIRSGGVKESVDCHRFFYWDDGRNPTRFLSPTKVPYLQTCTTSPTGCVTCVDTLPLTLDCSKITLAPKINVPCVTIRKAAYGGELINGSYQACIAYTINQERFGDYYAITNPQPIFNHVGIGGAIEVQITNLDFEYFTEFELVIVYTINGNTVAKKFGYYSTSEDARIGISIIPESLETIPLSQLPVRRPVYEKSDAVYTVGNYMLRVGPTTKFSFNYQPIANNINAYYSVWEVDANFYKNGGSVTGYMSDEVYPFFIRFLYDTGERTDSYHIPGRAPTAVDLAPISPINGNNFDGAIAWEGSDTSIPQGNPGTFYTDPATGISGPIISKGRMGYWESFEKYPNDSVRYGTLCNQPIRHHKFPSRSKDPNIWHHSSDGKKIRILGVQFDNILPPRDNSNILIPGIVGYEILRGSREGNKTIVAKGIFNNLLSFTDVINGVGITTHFQNFPYNQVEQGDPYLTDSKSYTKGDCDAYNTAPKANFSRNENYSFHSPDTQFKEPYLAPYEYRDYGTIEGLTDFAQFSPVENHPRHKLASDFTFFLSFYLGMATAVATVNGKRRIATVDLPNKITTDFIQGTNIAPGGPLALAQATYLGGVLPVNLATGIAGNAQTGAITLTTIGQILLGISPNVNAASDYTGNTPSDPTSVAINILHRAPYTPILGGPGITAANIKMEYTEGILDGLPPFLKLFYGVPLFLNAWSEGTDKFMELVMKLVPYRQFVYQFRSHLLYKSYVLPAALNFSRRQAADSGYINSGIYSTASTNVRIDNSMRNKYVYARCAVSFNHAGLTDDTRFSIGDMKPNIEYDVALGNSQWKNPDRLLINTRVSQTKYGAVVNKIVNQYGQLDSVNQIPVSSCFVPASTSPLQWNYSTGYLFGGDIYIGRHTEKNTFYFFKNWLQNKPDGHEIDYRKYNTLQRVPRYWMNTEGFEISDMLRGIKSSIANIFNGSSFQNPPAPFNPDDSVYPSDDRSLDQDPSNCGLSPGDLRFGVKNAYMYLFNSGVRDFFVESEINVDLRDWSDETRYRHYSPYNFNDVDTLFHPDIIRDHELYKYDFSLSHSKIFYDKISWGNIQPRSYDPVTYQDCYVYDPNMVIYSLPDNQSLVDNWRVYLPNNYKNISGGIVNIKKINKNGSLMLFNDRSPVMIQGSDSLETDLGTKVTLGDGGLFEQPLQDMSSSDLSFMEGSCIDTLGVINCAAGIYIMSNKLKKIYRVKGQGLEDITMKGMKWWFNTYMGYRILEDFPDFPDTNNLAIGVGSFITYDQESSILYFTKRDYAVNPQHTAAWTYVYAGGGKFTLVSKNIPGLKLKNIKLTSTFFIDTSWTVSFDPKSDIWVSFHDWHPNFTLSSKSKFIAIKEDTFWRHNLDLGSFCKFYGVDYPWEVEIPVNQKQVSIINSFEYFLDAVKYNGSPDISSVILDQNFDRAVVYNNEQCSGELQLISYPRNNPYLAATYPIVVGNLIQILFSKEENKYRFNDFYDIVNDRGEISNNPQPIWLVGKDGYKGTLNPAALNYNKPDLQQKRIRNLFQRVRLSKTVSGSINFVFKIFNSKSIISPR